MVYRSGISAHRASPVHMCACLHLSAYRGNNTCSYFPIEPAAQMTCEFTCRASCPRVSGFDRLVRVTRVWCSGRLRWWAAGSRGQSGVASNHLGDLTAFIIDCSWSELIRAGPLRQEGKHLWTELCSSSSKGSPICRL